MEAACESFVRRWLCNYKLYDISHKVCRAYGFGSFERYLLYFVFDSIKVFGLSLPVHLG